LATDSKPSKFLDSDFSKGKPAFEDVSGIKFFDDPKNEKAFVTVFFNDFFWGQDSC
jgi:hypothetical protein